MSHLIVTDVERADAVTIDALGAHETVTALPAMAAPCWIGRMPAPAYPIRPIASCTVAEPSAARASTVAASARWMSVTTTCPVTAGRP